MKKILTILAIACLGVFCAVEPPGDAQTKTGRAKYADSTRAAYIADSAKTAGTVSTTDSVTYAYLADSVRTLPLKQFYADTSTWDATRAWVIASYLLKVDTASLSARINLKADSSTVLYWPDTSAVIATQYDLTQIEGSDTTSLSNRINLKADSSTVLYWPDTTAWIATQYDLAQIQGSDTTSLSNRIDLKADSSTVLYWADTTLTNGVATNADVNLRMLAAALNDSIDLVSRTITLPWTFMGSTQSWQDSDGVQLMQLNTSTPGTYYNLDLGYGSAVTRLRFPNNKPGIQYAEAAGTYRNAFYMTTANVLAIANEGYNKVAIGGAVADSALKVSGGVQITGGLVLDGNLNDGALVSIGTDSASIPYMVTSDSMSNVNIGSGLSFASGVLSATGDVAASTDTLRDKYVDSVGRDQGAAKFTIPTYSSTAGKYNHYRTWIADTSGYAASGGGNGLVLKSDTLKVAPTVYNVVAFGAKGNGTANDSAAIAQAIAAAKSGGGGIVFFPEGTYLTGYQTVDSSNIVIQGTGAGSIWKVRNTSTVHPGLRIMRTTNGSVVSTNPHNITVRDMAFLGTVDTDAFSEFAHNISVSGASDVLIENCKITGFRGDGVYIGGEAATGGGYHHSTNVTVRHCYFDGINYDNRNGVSVTSATGVLIEDCYFTRTTRGHDMPGPIDLEPWIKDQYIRNVTIRNNTFFKDSCNVGIVSVYLWTQDSLTIPSSNIVIEGNTIDSCYADGGYGFYVGALTAITPTDSTPAVNVNIRNNRVSNFNGGPFGIFTVGGVTLQGNEFYSTGHPYVGGVASGMFARSIRILDNNFQLVGTTDPYAMNIYNIKGLWIRGNTFYRCSDGTFPAAMLNFKEDCSSDQVWITENRFIDGGTPDLDRAAYFQATHTSTPISTFVANNDLDGLIISNMVGAFNTGVEVPDSTNTFGGSGHFMGSLKIDNNLTGSTSIRGTNTFTTTATSDTVLISGAASTDIYIVCPIAPAANTLPVAGDLLNYFAKTDTLIVNRAVGSTSGLGYSWIRIK